MATIITRIVGSGAGATDASPADAAAWILQNHPNLTPAGSDVIIRVLLQKQKFTVTSGRGFSLDTGIVCGPNNYIELGTVDGASIFDNPNPLRYDATQGAAIEHTVGSNACIRIAVPYFRMWGIQILCTDQTTNGYAGIFLATGATNCRFDRVIVEGYCRNTSYGGIVRLAAGTTGEGTNTFTNSAAVQRDTNAASYIMAVGGVAGVHNCTLVSLGGTVTNGISKSSGTLTIKNSYIGGAQNPLSSTTGVTADNCFASASQAGFDGVIPMDSTTFNSVTVGTHDLRLASGSQLIDAGTSISSGTDAGYSPVSINNVDRSAAGATAFDVGAWEYSAPATVPVITTEPSDSSVPSGSNATFSVVATGSPAPTYQWAVSTDGGTNWSNLSGQTSASLQLNAVTTADNGKKYRCTVTNSEGSDVSNVVTLTVTVVAPSITVQPAATQSVQVGSAVSFSVQATGTAPLSYQWSESTDGGTNWSNVGSDASTYTIASAVLSDSGKKFRCTVSNSAGLQISSVADLTVTEGVVAVSFTGQVPAQTGNVGSALSLPLASYFSGSATPFTYSVFSGSLPTGTALNTTTGEISGTLSTAGSFSAIIRATDTAGNTANTTQIAFTVTTVSSTPRIITDPIKNNTGSLLASISGWTVNVYDAVTGDKVVQVAGLTTNSAGVLVIEDQLLQTGVQYAYDPIHATYGRRLPIGTAS